jgi:hypothetical protein
MGAEVVMPIHDWRKVDRGVFHSLHTTWIGELTIRLNGGILPPQYFALGEQIAGEVGPDVLALREPTGNSDRDEGGIAIEIAPPQVQTTAEAEAQFYARKQRRLAIRHASDNEIVALIEIVSPSNKHSRRNFDSFVRESLDAIEQGVHLLLIDLHPPSSRDPQGIHGAIWQELGGVNRICFPREKIECWPRTRRAPPRRLTPRRSPWASRFFPCPCFSHQAAT